MTTFYSHLNLDRARPLLESAADTHGVTLDFLMKTWNGRFATFNVGIPTDTGADMRRGVRDEPRRYRLLGRVKANTQGTQLLVTLNPPTACDLTPTDEEQARWDAFAADVQARLT